jgi:hypothetical protein
MHVFAMPAALPTRAFEIPGSRGRCSENKDSVLLMFHCVLE